MKIPNKRSLRRLQTRHRPREERYTKEIRERVDTVAGEALMRGHRSMEKAFLKTTH
jgi:hypothetical protein